MKYYARLWWVVQGIRNEFRLWNITRGFGELYKAFVSSFVYVYNTTTWSVVLIVLADSL